VPGAESLDSRFRGNDGVALRPGAMGVPARIDTAERPA
jgi:hypothetical protein